MLIKLRFTRHQTALASRAYPDNDLSTLRAVVPNANYANFDPADNMHYDGGWHPNGEGQSKKTKKTISGYTKAAKKRQKAIEAQKKKEKLERDRQHGKDGGQNGESGAVVDKSTSADYSSLFGLGNDVLLEMKNIRLPAKVLAVTFIAGKVLYTLALYTGWEEPTALDLTNRYGLINNLGWDEEGREYTRIDNVDSTFVVSANEFKD